MTIDTNTMLSLIGLGGGALLVAGGWVLSIEKRVNGLKYLHRRVETQGVAIQRIDRVTALIAFKLGVEVPDSEPTEGIGL